MSGSCCFYVTSSAGEKVLFSGDTLFKGNIGKWVFPGGSFEQLIASVQEQLFNLDDDTPVIPGHGESTTIGAEKQNNVVLKPRFIEQTRREVLIKRSNVKGMGCLTTVVLMPLMLLKKPSNKA
jgi:glyoxylase-like metal-dependent hydrolase (beta-lactamase superfamily II)